MIVVGRVLSAKQTKRRRAQYGMISAPLVEGSIVITHILKGSPGTIVKVESEGSDNGANCGMGNALLALAQSRKSIAFAIENPLPDKRGRFDIGGCWAGDFLLQNLP